MSQLIGRICDLYRQLKVQPKVPVLIQVKVLRDPNKKDKEGNPQPKGIAFAEFADHEHALCALRQLNNNPGPFGAPYVSRPRPVSCKN